ncbi:MAG TPA: carboxypeptidase-like regulatory domain-containing protein, partial [Thermoanaerobaculia bacterium]|nr:carboxypeptidase-like regulatory domain-containing protein [Thermoanaerobaculia bacterium]
MRLIGEVHTVNLVFLGRGTAEGYVRYADGEPLEEVNVVIGSTLFGHFRSGTTNDQGFFSIGDLPVGPLTFSVVDPDGRTTFAANAIRFAGEIIKQDLIVERTQFPGTGTVKVSVRRADTNELIPGAHVGVYTQGYALRDAFADANGYAEFHDVPAGLISIIASAFHISRETPGIELEMRADQTIEQTIFIGVPPPTSSGYAALTGTVRRDDPASPGDASKDVIVPGAIITIAKLPAVTANADGTYFYPDIPVQLAGKPTPMLVFDPATGRKAWFDLPSLFPNQTSQFSPRMSSSDPNGEATIRVRLTSATGAPVTDYRVIEPGFPPEVFAHVGNGVYELTGVRVPRKVAIVAVPTNPNGPWGEQMATGAARVDFGGQIAIVDMRLPGQGTIITRLELRQDQDACPTSEPCYTQAFGKVAVSYSVWDETEQSTRAKTVVKEADPVTQLNTFTKIPARQGTGVYTDRHPAGFASAAVTLAYEGDVHTITLRMDTIGDVTGRVFAYDRQTPVAGALVKLENDRVIYGQQLTKPDGSFRFAGVPAGLGFRIVAETTRDGIYRKGYADGQTPGAGGPVSNLLVVMREQSNIEGQVVDADGNPVPLARYSLSELAWPYTRYGTEQEPLQADINGRFYLTNVFTGPFRMTARSPVVQEQRGNYQGELRFEGDNSQLQIRITIGTNGTGTITARVVDSSRAFAVVENAEVKLFRGDYPFDLSSTNEHGVVTFTDLPAGSEQYWLTAYSKAAGRAGSTSRFTLASGATVERELVLEFLGKVAGYVTDPEDQNRPSIGDPVQMESGQVIQRTSTDGEGKFSILGVPEGPFKLFAYDMESGRMAFGPPNLFISKVVQEYNDLHLELERTAVLTVNVHLPTDNGGQGELAPLVDVLVEAHDYFREAQGQSLQFPKMIPRYGYKITARELGGEHRKIIDHGTWPANTFAKTHSLTFPSTGSVEVKVLDNQNQPVVDAMVNIGGTTIYTPADGIVRLTGVPFGWISVRASKGSLGASDGKLLQSRSIPLQFTLNLGATIDVDGFVEAEEGIGVPSVGTRVLIEVSSSLISSQRRLETFTGPDGGFKFTGIPVGNTVLRFKYYGPDDTTIGAEPDPQSVPNTQTGTFT